MGSVGVRWSGHCTSREARLGLCKFVDELAKCSHSLFEDFEEPPQIKYWDTTINGKILLPDRLLEETTANRCGIKLIETEEEVDYSGTTKLVKWPVLDNVDLYGIEFNLYDPRGGSAGEKMNFVFLLHECPEINGSLVIVEDHDECQYYNSVTIQQADWYLPPPSMRLRYYLENWFDYMMGWTKYFFIPDLFFWRYGDLKGYGDLKEKLDALLVEAKDKTSLQRAVFEDVLERFEYEAIEWWNAIYGFEHNKIRVPKLSKIKDRSEEMTEKTEEEAGEGDGSHKEVPLITEDGRINMDAFEGVYSREKIERDKNTVRRVKEIMSEELPNMENIRRKLRKGK